MATSNCRELSRQSKCAHSPTSGMTVEHGEMRDIARTATDRQLLGWLSGMGENDVRFEGSLMSLFSGAEATNLAHQCAVARELVRRALVEELGHRPPMTSPTDVRELLALHFLAQDHESFVVMFLDAQHHLIELTDMFRGTLSQTAVYPREVARLALRKNAAAVIVAHNHPSGRCEPSAADRSLTAALKESLALVDVRVLDHVIVATPMFFSFAERGIL